MPADLVLCIFFVQLLLTFDFSEGKKLAAMGDNGGLTVLSLATLQGRSLAQRDILGKCDRILLIFLLVGDKEMVSWLLESFPETSDISNSSGNQPVHFAAAQGSQKMCVVIM